MGAMIAMRENFRVREPGIVATSSSNRLRRKLLVEDGGGGGSVGDVITPEEQARLDALEAEGLRLEHLIGLLERYNGMSFVNVGELGVTRGGGFIGKREIDAATPGDGGGGVGPAPVYDVFVGLEAYQVQFLDKSYTELKQSLYDGLVLETRLKPYLDDVALTIDESGIRLDASAVAARLDAQHAIDPAAAYVDALELRMYARNVFPLAGCNPREAANEFCWEKRA